MTVSYMAGALDFHCTDRGCSGSPSDHALRTDVECGKVGGPARQAAGRGPWALHLELSCGHELTSLRQSQALQLPCHSSPVRIPPLCFSLCLLCSNAYSEEVHQNMSEMSLIFNPAKSGAADCSDALLCEEWVEYHGVYGKLVKTLWGRLLDELPREVAVQVYAEITKVDTRLSWSFRAPYLLSPGGNRGGPHTMHRTSRHMRIPGLKCKARCGLRR